MTPRDQQMLTLSGPYPGPTSTCVKGVRRSVEMDKGLVPLCGTVDASTLNLVYNLADFVNKIAFVLAIWAGAKEDSARMRGLLE